VVAHDEPAAVELPDAHTGEAVMSGNHWDAMVRQAAHQLPEEMREKFTTRCDAWFSKRPPSSQAEVTEVLTKVMLALRQS
jgi:hypothetical protein